MWGIQVNVGRVPTPDWRWIRNGTGDRYEYQTESEAKRQMDLWYPTHKSACFRVHKIDEE